MPLRVSEGRPIHVIGLRPGATQNANALSVPLFAQEQTLWCWAACCAMVFSYRNAPQSQCAIANYGLGFSNCCNDPLPPACNDTIWTTHPTERDIPAVYRHFGRTCTHRFGSVSFADLRTEIDSTPGRPIEVCYAWAGGGSHVALVRGYRENTDGSRFVMVNDPAYSYGVISFASLQTAYGLGSWVETFTGIG